jgi:hypothetical protein
MIMFKRARDLSVGDVFSLHVYGEVVAVASVADGKRMKVRISLEDQGGQGARSYRDSHERAPFGHDVRKSTNLPMLVMSSNFSARRGGSSM